VLGHSSSPPPPPFFPSFPPFYWIPAATKRGSLLSPFSFFPPFPLFFFLSFSMGIGGYITSSLFFFFFPSPSFPQTRVEKVRGSPTSGELVRENGYSLSVSSPLFPSSDRNCTEARGFFTPFLSLPPLPPFSPQKKEILKAASSKRGPRSFFSSPPPLFPSPSFFSPHKLGRRRGLEYRTSVLFLFLFSLSLSLFSSQRI